MATPLGAILLDTDTTVLDLFDATAGLPTINAGTGRSGGASLRCTGAGTGVAKNLASNIGTLNHIFAWLPGGLGAGELCDVRDAGTAQVTIKTLADGTLQAFRGSVAGTLLGSSAVGAVSVAVYQSIEVAVTISATVGTVQIWVNGVSVLNLTGQNTKNTANTTVSAFAIFAPATANNDFCDIIWSTARITDLVVDCKMPTGAGNHTDFTPSAGSNWQNVDETPPNADTDYNETLTVNAIDSFTHAAISGAPASIAAVIVQVRARNTAAGSGSVAPFVRSSTTDSVGTAVALNTTFQTFQSVYGTDPATGSAWANATAVNAAEIGYKKTV
jgi:hypothetical protein